MSETLSESLVRDLRRVVGEDAVITGADRLLAYESDGLTSYRMPPAAVVLPADTAEASRVVAALHGAGVTVVPRGAGTGLSGGALAVEGSVVVGTSRMNRILELDGADRRARVQAGTVNARLSEAAGPLGLFYAPDPSSQSTCTLGGNVAENSGGPHCLKYGVTSRYVTGLMLVLAGGEVVELGGVGGGEGLDLVGVVVGSEGCFGLVTEVEVRLLPLPEGVRTLMAVFERIEDAGRAVTDVIGRGLLPAALEIVDGETIRAVESSVFAAGYPVGAGAALVVEFDGPVAGLDEEVAEAVACCRGAGAREIRRARDEAEREALWKGRKKAFGAMGRVAPDLMVQDATVPRTRLPEVLARIGEIARRHELTVANVFHAGDGNLHPNILFDRRDAAELERVERASKEIMAACVEAGGTITGEHGVGLDKRRYMPLVHGPVELAAMAAVKEVFDPDARFNPGKVLPEGSAGGEPAPVRGAAAPAPGVAPGPDGLVRRLEGLLGGDRVVRVGGGGAPVVSPRSTGEVATLLEAATAEGWRVFSAGAGLHPGSARHRSAADVVLSTSGLRSVVEYEPADLTLTAQAGLDLAGVAGATGPRGQWLPLDPPGSSTVTLGGALATGLAGPLAGRYGRPRDLVLGLTCVTGDGRVLGLGGRVVKNVAGFDLVKLLVGSHGCLGVIVDATVRLFPLPAADRFLVAGAEVLEALVPRLRAVALAPAMPGAVVAGELPGEGAGAVAVVRLLGSGAAAAAEERVVLERAPGFAPVESGEGRRILDALCSDDPRAGLSVRMSFPPGALAPAVDAARALTEGAGSRGAEARVVVHADRGALRWSATWGGEGGVPGDPGGWIGLLEEVRRAVESLGGSFSLVAAPHGWPQDLLAVRRAPAIARIERELGRRFDPGGVLLPGLDGTGHGTGLLPGGRAS